jgi:hypothetical protein
VALDLLKLGTVKKTGSRYCRAVISSIGKVEFGVGNGDEESHWDDLNVARSQKGDLRGKEAWILTHTSSSVSR